MPADFTPLNRIAHAGLNGLAGAVLLVLSSLAAAAGDTAGVRVLGFNATGTFFAFEQYGIQDGSGFPYSEIFVLDVIGDSWVKPSPFRRRDMIDDSLGYDPEALLKAARAANLETAQGLLAAKAISGKGKTVAHNPPSELSSLPHNMTVAPRFPQLPGDTPMELTLAEYPLKNAECAGYGAAVKGFRLTLQQGGTQRLLNQDTSVPASRRCPLSYRIDRIITHYPAEAPPVFAILIQVESLGFEGPDHRYLAITGRL